MVVIGVGLIGSRRAVPCGRASCGGRAGAESWPRVQLVCGSRCQYFYRRATGGAGLCLAGARAAAFCAQWVNFILSESFIS